MNFSSEIIDRIVQSVMRELSSRKATSSANAPQFLLTDPTANSDTNAVRITEKVISEETLTAASAAGRIISIRPQAVITPSGRDYIRRHNVQVTSSLVKSGTMANQGLLLNVGTVPSTDSVAAAAGWQSANAGNEHQAVGMAESHADHGRVVCCGGEPSLVACLLNRKASIRAAVATRSTNLNSLHSLMQPQVICIESSGWSFAELLRLLNSLHPITDKPSAWREVHSGAGT